MIQNFFLFLTLISIQPIAFAQTTDSLGFSPLGLTLSTGINNSVGMLGMAMYYAPSQKILTEAGIGMGSWGSKLSANVQYYPRNNKRIFLKGSYSFSTGVQNLQLSLESTNHKIETFYLDFLPAHNISISLGRTWVIANNHRFYIEGGYSKLMASPTDLYKVVRAPAAQTELSENSRRSIEFTVPSGIVLAMGFSLGL